MRRFLVPLAAVLVAAPLAAQVAVAVAAPALTERLADRLYTITTYLGAPIGVKVLALLGPEGVLLVDSGDRRGTSEVRAALDAIGAGPVRIVVNTHYHDDHVGGNAVLGKGALVIAHDAVARRWSSGLALLAPPPEGTVPAMTFGSTLTLRFGGEEVRLVHRPASHTDGDVTVQFVHAGVVAVGDLVFADHFPYVDVEAGGSVAGLLATLDALRREFPEGTRFVAAHGPVYSTAQLASYRRELAAMDERIGAALAAGATVERMQADGVLHDWASWGGSYVSAAQLVSTLAASPRAPLAPGLPPVLDRLVQALVAGHGDDAVRLYRTLKAQQPPAYTFAERDLNRLGYALLGGGRHDDAIAILTLNVEEHPDSWNAYDSLGEACATAGRRGAAIANYSKSLELNPANDHAIQALAHLNGR